MAAIEEFPTELVLMVFSNIDSPKDLHSLILASRHCYQVFSAAPERILWKTIEKAILPEALPHAIAAISLPKSDIKEVHVNQEIVEQFCEQYFESDSLPGPTDKETMFSLSSLCVQVEHFANDYSKRASREVVAFNPVCRDFAVPEISASSRTSKGPLSSKKLSYDERVRFQRAFFRYELYCRLFPVSEAETRKKDIPATFPSDFQFRQFISHLRPWEVEELSCVLQYLIYTIAGLADKIEDQAVVDILAASRRRPSLWAYTSCQGLKSTESREESPAPFDGQYSSIARNRDISYDIDAWENRLRDLGYCQDNHTDRELPEGSRDSQRLKAFQALSEFPRLRGQRLDLFTATGRDKSIKHFAYHAAFGLAYVRHLLNAEYSVLYKALVANCGTKRRFLPEALSHARFFQSPSNPSNLKCNRGWTDYGAGPFVGYAQTSHSMLASFALRARAYVFWDDSRISEYERKFIEARGMIFPRRRSLFDRAQFRSVEERVKGCLLEEEDIERIITKYQGRNAEAPLKGSTSSLK